MALLYADENIPLQVVQALRALGYDVLTATLNHLLADGKTLRVLETLKV